MLASPFARKILLFLCDISLLYLALFFTLIFGFGKNLNLEIFLNHLFPFTLLYLFWLIIFYIFGFYDLDFPKNFTFYIRLLNALGLSLIGGVIFFYLFPFFGISPKTNLLLNVLIFGVLFYLWRKFFYYIFSVHFLNRVAIVGKNPQTRELVKEIKNRPYLGYKLVAFLKPAKEDFLTQIKQKKIDTLILAVNPEKNPALAQNLYQCLFSRINFLDLAQAFEIIAEKIPISFVSKIWFLENLREREKEFYEKLKRFIDIILAFFILLISFPFLFFIALAVKLEDGGPIFYIQERIGKNKKPFFLIKFRSMKLGAERPGEPIWAEKEDSRVTKVGKFLRRFHLDEIPQMLNVLKGEISLVGPRPERPEFVEKLEKEIPHYHLRHLIKPGFTGWAQIKFRYARSVRDSFEKFQYDLYYIKNRSFFLDLRILLKTFQLFFKKE